MRKLLNVLYVTSPDAYLSLEGETVSILRDSEEIFRIPLLNLEGIVTFGYTGASPALMGACAKSNISLCFMTANGRFQARVIGEIRGNVILRKTQFMFSEDNELSTKIAKSIICGKLFNGRWILERTTRDHPMRVDVEKFKTVSKYLKDSIQELEVCTDLETLRGVEGKAAAQYFSVFDDLILQQKKEFFFKGRNRRPPLDNVNALLSFVYTLLANDITSALETVGLDPYVGFLHRDRPGRASLSLDLMEELRPVLADRFVLSLINKKIVNGSGFKKMESTAVIMDDETRKTVLNAWQERKKESITHPFISEKIPWGLVPYVQSQLLARYLRDDTDAYPPFLWK